MPPCGDGFHGNAMTGRSKFVFFHIWAVSAISGDKIRQIYMRARHDVYGNYCNIYKISLLF